MIDKKEIITKLNEALTKGKKRKFSQSIDLSIGLKGLNMKNPNETVEEIITLPKNRGKPVKICGLVDKEMETDAKKVFDLIILKTDFPKWMKDIKNMKKLANDYDFFVAQANIMADIAKTFGRVFGPRGKMPNPKASCVVPPGAKLEIVKERLKKTIVLKAKKGPVINIRVGTEKENIEDVAENIHVILDQLIKHLTSGENNIKHVHVKTTMGPSIRLM